MLKAYRASILRFDRRSTAVCVKTIYDQDGLLIAQKGVDGLYKIVQIGDYTQIKNAWDKQGFPITKCPWSTLKIEDRRGYLIAPGFIDLHIHYPQINIIGSPATGLLPWLQAYTFPEESKFIDREYARETANFFIEELLRQGVTTALVFATSHVNSVHALFDAALEKGLRLITGKVLQDRYSPDSICDQTEQSLIDTQTLIEHWHARNRLGYAITPRFALTSSPEQLKGAGELAQKYTDVWVQSHAAENKDEIAQVKELFPQARSYLLVYDHYGLLRKRSVYAHCIHIDAMDRRLMYKRQAAAAISPTSNLFLGSGFFDYKSANDCHMLYGLASDVGGGTSFSPFDTMLAAYYVGQEGQTKRAVSLAPEQLWWQHTMGAAQALDLGDVVGNLDIGYEADFIIIDVNATPMLSRKIRNVRTLSELLFSLIVLGDDRLVVRCVLASEN